MTMPTDTSTAEKKPCPICGEMIVATAKKCRFCGEFLDSTHPNSSSATTPTAVPTYGTQIVPNEIVLPLPPQAAFQQVIQAMQKLGSVKQTDATKKTVTGAVRTGVAMIKVDVSVVEVGRGQSRVVIQSARGDVWGWSTRNVNRRFTQTLRNLDNPAFKVDRFGAHPVAVLFGVVLVVIVSGLAAWWVASLLQN